MWLFKDIKNIGYGAWENDDGNTIIACHELTYRLEELILSKILEETCKYKIIKSEDSDIGGWESVLIYTDLPFDIYLLEGP